MRVSNGFFAAASRAIGPCLSHRAALPTAAMLVAACVMALARPADEDPNEIVRRALLLNSEESKLRKEYTYIERAEDRHLNSKGEVSSRDVKTWDITQLNNRQFRRLIQHNDQPLTPKEGQAEEARQKQAAARVAKVQERHAADTEEQRRQRQEAARERQRKAEERDADDIIGCHNLRLVGSDEIDGVPVWVVEGTPHTGYKFQDKDNIPFAKIQGRVWISKVDYQPVKVEAETIDTISFGGILARIQKGAQIRVEFTRVNSEVWLPKHFSVTFAARLLLLKGLHQEEDLTYSNYRKFVAESRIVE